MESIGSHLQNLYFIQNYMDNQYFLAADHIIAAFRNSIFRIHFHAGQLHPFFYGHVQNVRSLWTWTGLRHWPVHFKSPVCINHWPGP